MYESMVQKMMRDVQSKVGCVLDEIEQLSFNEVKLACLGQMYKARQMVSTSYVYIPR